MTSPEATDEAVPLAAAARVLGISRAAVRQRIRRGSLPAFKVDDRWYVHGSPTGPADMVVGTGTATTTNLDSPEERSELIAALRDEIAFLRHALDEQLAAVRRKDETIADLTSHLLALTPPPIPPAASG